MSCVIASNCKRCGKEKTVENCGQYLRKETRKFYFKSHCKTCCCTKAKQYRFENKEKVRASQRRLQEQDPQRWKEMGNIRNKKRRIRDIAKLETRWRTANLVERGDIPRLPCVYCGNAKTQAHHTNYNDPLLVEWLCHNHHRAWHRVFLAEEAN